MLASRTSSDSTRSRAVSLMVRVSTITRETPKTAITTSTTASVDWIVRRLMACYACNSIGGGSGGGAAQLEAETDTAQGGDVAGVGRIVTLLLTQPADVHVERLGRRPRS